MRTVGGSPVVGAARAVLCRGRCGGAAVVAVARAAEALPDVEEHFSALAQLPLRTALVVKMGTRIYAGKFAGVIDRGRGPVIR